MFGALLSLLPPPTPPIPFEDWASETGTLWTISGAVATASGTAAGTENLLGPLLPDEDCWWEVAITGVWGVNGIVFAGVAVASAPPTGYAGTGYSAWYGYGGTFWRDGSSVGSAPSTLSDGALRFALNHTDGRLYAAFNGGTPGSVLLPSGYDPSDLCPLILPQGGFTAPATSTLYEVQLGSGGLF